MTIKDEQIKKLRETNRELEKEIAVLKRSVVDLTKEVTRYRICNDRVT